MAHASVRSRIPSMKAICPRCGKEVRLTAAGLLFAHKVKRIGYPKQHKMTPFCIGSAYRVDEVKQMMRLEAKA